MQVASSRARQIVIITDNAASSSIVPYTRFVVPLAEIINLSRQPVWSGCELTISPTTPCLRKSATCIGRPIVPPCSF